MALVDALAQYRACLVVTVREDEARTLRCDAVEPVQQFSLPGMGREAAQVVDRGTHDDRLAEDVDLRGTISQRPAEDRKSVV